MTHCACGVDFADKSCSCKMNYVLWIDQYSKTYRFRPRTTKHVSKHSYCKHCQAPYGMYHHVGCIFELCFTCRLPIQMNCSCKNSLETIAFALELPEDSNPRLIEVENNQYTIMCRVDDQAVTYTLNLTTEGE